MIELFAGSAKSKTCPEIMSQIDLTGMPLSIDAVRTPGDGYPMSAWFCATNFVHASASPIGPAISFALIPSFEK